MLNTQSKKANAVTWNRRIDNNPEQWGVKASDVARGRSIIRKVYAGEAVEDAKRVRREQRALTDVSE